MNAYTLCNKKVHEKSIKGINFSFEKGINQNLFDLQKKLTQKLF